MKRTAAVLGRPSRSRTTPAVLVYSTRQLGNRSLLRCTTASPSSTLPGPELLGASASAIFNFALHSGTRHASTNCASASSASSPAANTHNNEKGTGKNGDENKKNRQGSKPRQLFSRASLFESYRVYRQARHARQDKHYQTLSMYLDRLPPGLRELLLYSPLLALFYFVIFQARVYYLDDEEPWFYVLVPSPWRYRAGVPESAIKNENSSKKKMSEADGADVSTARCAASAAHVSSLLKRAPTSQPIVFTSTENVSLTAARKADKTATEVKECSWKGTSAHIETSTREDTSNPDSTTKEMDLTAVVTTATTYRYSAAYTHDPAVAAASAHVPPPVVAPFHEVTVRRRVTGHATATSSISAGEKAQLKGVESKTAESPDTSAAAALAQEHPYGVWGAPLYVLRDPTTNKVIGYSTNAAACAAQ